MVSPLAVILAVLSVMPVIMSRLAAWNNFQ